MRNGRNKIVDGVWFGAVGIQCVQIDNFRCDLVQVALQREFSVDCHRQQ